MELNIEKMIYGGDGLARISGGEGRALPVFIPFVLPGEKVRAEIIEEKSSFARARATALLEPSPKRIQPGCPYFVECGGCHYQHAGYADQLQIKVQVLRETLARTARIEWDGDIPAHSANEWNYRNRTRLHHRAAPRFQLGYFRAGSHQLLDIRECPISSTLLNRAITALWQVGEAKLIPSAVQDIELFASHDDGGLLLELYLTGNAEPRPLRKLYDALAAAVTELRGLAAFPAATFAGSALWQHGEAAVQYCVGERAYQVSTGSFFQVNRFLAEKLVELMTAGRSGSSALDLYAGTGLFTLPLAEAFDNVSAVESASWSFRDLEENAPARVDVLPLSVEAFLGSRAAAVKSADYVLLDPPRAGLGQESCRALAAAAPREIGYLSCDPATLARDLRVLVESGYRVQSVQLVDLFPQTFHIETAVHLAR